MSWAAGWRTSRTSGSSLLPLLFVAVIIRFGTEAALRVRHRSWRLLASRSRCFATAYGLLLFTLWHNRWYPGMALVFIGITANGLGDRGATAGRMPVWQPPSTPPAWAPPLSSVLHYACRARDHAADIPARVSVRFGDVIPIPIDPVRNVASIGDLFLTAGLGFFLFATLIRGPGGGSSSPAGDVRVAPRCRGITGTARLPRPATPPTPRASACARARASPPLRRHRRRSNGRS